MRIRYNTEREWENYIQETRVAKGMTIKELAEKSGTTPSSLVQLMNGMISPIYQMSKGEYSQGTIKPWVERICLILDTKPEIMFPREVCPLEDPRLKGLHQTQIDEISLSEYCQNQNISDVLDSQHMRKFIWRYIVKKFWFRKDQDWELYPRRYKDLVKVIQLRFLCDMTLADIGKKLNVCLETIRSREAKAFRLMRHLNFTKGLP